MRSGVSGWIAVATVSVFAAACAPNPVPALPGPPKYVDYPKPDAPAALRVTADVRDRHERAWALLQAGDLGGAGRAFAELLQRAPSFYPAEAGAGFAALAERQYRQAGGHFTAALAKNPRYLPALQGQVEAQIRLRNDAGAIDALEEIVKIDATQEAARSRLDLLRMRVIQTEIEASRRARDGGRLDDAQAALERALEMAPTAAVVLRELAAIETSRGALDAAEAHARKSLQLDAGDAESQAVLGGVLEARGRYGDAAAAYAKAAAIDPRPAWRDKVDALRAKAFAASIPAEYRAIPTAATVTRAQVAAIIGLRLSEVLDRAGKRQAVVVTDIRGHWAAQWIVAVTQAAVMDVLPNHTFQPGAAVRRGDLASIVSHVLPLATGRRPEDLARWRSARPRFADLASTHLSYAAAAVAVSAGVMAVQDDRFAAARLATGAELVAAIARLEQIAGR